MTALVGRDGELRVLRRALRATGQGGGGLVAVSGASGLGKTVLITTAAAEAEAAGIRVARAQGAELERGLALGLFRRLLGPAARAEGLLDHAPSAARSLLGPGDEAADAEEYDPLTAAGALVWVCAVLAERGPLLLVVDDAQWADDASLRVLAAVRERLGEAGVLLLLATRPVDGTADLAALVEDPRTIRLDLRPLNVQAVEQVVRARAPRATDAQVAAVVAASGGTPFYVTALADELAAGATDLGVDAPHIVARSVLRRVREVGPDGVAVAGAVAVLGNDAHPRYVAALSGLPDDRATAAAEALVRAGVLEEAVPYTFPHAIVAGAVHDELAGAGRSQEHRRAAEVLRAAGAPPHRVAVQLAAVEPAGDQALVDELVAAAAAGTGPGSRETAAILLRRALDEPPDEERRVTVLAALGSAQRQAMRPEARDHLTAALEHADGELRLALLLELAAVDEQAGRLGDATDTLKGVLAQLDAAGVDEATRAVFAATVAIGRVAGILSPVEVELEERLERLDQDTWEATVTAGVLATVHHYRASAPPEAVEAWLRRGFQGWLRREVLERPVGLGVLPTATANGFEQLVLDAVDVAEGARLTGSMWTAPALATWRALAALAAGRLDEADADAAAAVEAFGPVIPPGLAASTAVLAEVRLERFGLEAAAAALEPLRALGDLIPGLQAGMALRAQAKVALAHGDLATARRWAERLRDVLAPSGIDEPSLLGWRAELALALARSGEDGEPLAVEHLALAEARAQQGTIADALLVLAEVGDPAQRAERLDRAIAVAERAQRPLVRAAAHAALGRHLSATGDRDAARTHLEAALALVDATGAAARRPGLEADLQALGIEPPAATEPARRRLSSGELRLARLAAEGLTDHDIARALFLTPAEVAAELGGALRKLGVRSRHELATALNPAA